MIHTEQHEHRYAVSGVLHVHATQHYHNASQASLNTCIIYITSHRGSKYNGLTATREVGTTVGRNVNRSYKQTTIIYYFSTQICKLWSFVNSWNKDDGLSRLKLGMNNSQKHRRPIIWQTIIFSMLFNDAVKCYNYSVGEEWMNGVWGIGGKILTGEKWSTLEETCPSAIMPITNPTHTGQELNPSICSNRQETNRLKHGMA